MLLSYYAARANLYHLWQQHPQWDHASLAAALGSSKGWVKKWLKRFREAQAAGVPLADILPGHSRARKHPQGLQRVRRELLVARGTSQRQALGQQVVRLLVLAQGAQHLREQV